MKPGSTKKFSQLKRVALLVSSSVALASACSRPDYGYSDDVPIKGTGATSSFPGFAGTTSTGAAPPVDPCGLDRRGGTPAFAKQAISDAQPIRTEAYIQLTDSEVETLEKTHTLVPKPSQAAPGALTNLLAQLRQSATDPQRSLLSALTERFRYTRTTWPNPWALRLVEHPASEHMNPVLVKFKPDAWFVRIADRVVSVLDVNNGPVTIESAVANPGRIAAIYYVIDDTAAGVSNACEGGLRELALGNEAMVESFSIGTSEILARLNADLSAFETLFQAARPCSSVDKGGGQTFHTYTVCTSWDYFDALSEYSAYVWALSNPVEQYKPSSQNISNLVEALKADRFDPAPFEAAPNPVPDPIITGGTGGTGGVGGFGGIGGVAAGGSSGSGGSAGSADFGGAGPAGGAGAGGDGGAGP